METEEDSWFKVLDGFVACVEDGYLATFIPPLVGGSLSRATIFRSEEEACRTAEIWGIPRDSFTLRPIRENTQRKIGWK